MRYEPYRSYRVICWHFTTFAIIPQIYKAIKTQKVEDVSPVFLSILIVGVGLWTIYGVLIKDYPIIITNGMCNQNLVLW